MKKDDFLVISGIAAISLVVIFIPGAGKYYQTLNSEHGILAAFFKFAILATFGEALGLRIKKGVYNEKGFGLFARAVVWGILGITIKMAFVIFGSGVPKLIEYLGVNDVAAAMKSSALTTTKVAGAFFISLFLNTIYAPVMMTLHKITDTHILQNGGKISALTRKIPFVPIFKQLDWHTQWHFVFKRTIPFFWIPAHTITFLLPENFQVLFAALLGIALGLILAFANLKKAVS